MANNARSAYFLDNVMFSVTTSAGTEKNELHVAQIKLNTDQHDTAKAIKPDFKQI